MRRGLLLFLVFMPAVSVHAGTGMVEKYLFEDNLKINIPKDWKHESFNIVGIKTEQFTNADGSIILSLCLEGHEDRSFTQYRENRYDAAKSDVWREIKARYAFSFNFEHDYKAYDYDREGKNRGKFRKFVICVDGLQKYCTVTVIAKKDALNDKMDLLNAIFNSVWIKVTTYD